MKLGVCYYPEYWSEEQWQIDAQMMHTVGLSVVRLGEYTWFKMEPTPGQFNWDWLDRIIRIMETEGLEVVLSTPTAAPPKWLLHQNPEILAVTKNGIRKNPGAQHNFCVNHPVFIEKSQNLVSELVQRYSNDTNVIGWQIDNEIGSYDSANCYCENCANKYRGWLQERYGEIANLNSCWGTTVWGQFYSSWEEITTPGIMNSPENPAMVLDYQRFSSTSIVDFINRQVHIIKEHSENQFVTHNIGYSNHDVDNFQLGRELDFISWNSFPTGHAEELETKLYAPWEVVPEFAYDVGDPYITGFLQALTFGVKNKPFWVMEQQCGQINWGKINPGIRAGAVRLWTWHAVASGAEAVLFDHWRATNFGQEQYQSGILLNDSSPDIGFHEVSNLIAESPVVSQLTEQPITSNIAILTNFDDSWALSKQNHRQGIDYWRVLFSYYQALTSLGITVDFVPSDSNLENYRLVLAPLMYLTDTHKVQQLESFVARGGALLLGVRSGYKDETNHLNDNPLPGLLRGLVGARIKDWQALPDNVRFTIRSDMPGLSGDAGIWIESINPDEDEGVNVLARYLGGPLSGKAALTEHAFGAGSAYYLGFYPTCEQIKSILSFLIKKGGIGSLLDLPEGVILKQRGNHRIAFNFTRNEKTFVFDDKMITLPPRDFRFFLRDWSS